MSPQKIIAERVQQIRDLNVKLMNHGNLHAYQYNCAKLEGIAYAMEVMTYG
jgi:hypothetical protein